MFRISLINAFVLSCLLGGVSHASDLEAATQYWEDAKQYADKFKTPEEGCADLQLVSAEKVVVEDLLQRLPTDIRLEIFSYLDQKDQRITRVSKTFYQDWIKLQEKELREFKCGLRSELIHFRDVAAVLEAVLYDMWKAGEIARKLALVPVNYDILQGSREEHQPQPRSFPQQVEQYLTALGPFDELKKLMVAEVLDMAPETHLHQVMLMSAVVEREPEGSELRERLDKFYFGFRDKRCDQDSKGEYRSWDADRQAQFRHENSKLFRIGDEFMNQLKDVISLKKFMLATKLLALSGEYHSVELLACFAASIFCSPDAHVQSLKAHPNQPNWVCYTDEINALKSVALTMRDIQVSCWIGDDRLQQAIQYGSYISSLFPGRHDMHLAHVFYAAEEYLLRKGLFQEAWSYNSRIVEIFNESNTTEIKWALTAVASGDKLDLIMKDDPEVKRLYLELMHKLDLSQHADIPALALKGLNKMMLLEANSKGDDNLEDLEQKLSVEMNQSMSVIHRFMAQAVLIFNDQSRMAHVDGYIKSIEGQLKDDEQKVCFDTSYKSGEELWDLERQYVVRGRNNALRAAYAITTGRFEEAVAYFEKGAELTPVLLISLKRQVGNTNIPDRLKVLLSGLIQNMLQEELSEIEADKSNGAEDLGTLRFYNQLFSQDFRKFYLMSNYEDLWKSFERVELQ